MISRGAIAYAHARMRAAKSRLLSRAEAMPLLLAGDAAGVARAASALGVDAPLRRLLRVYETALRADPRARPLLRLLLNLHEIENLKLLWRVATKPRHRAALPDLWLDLGTLATLPRTNATTVHELADALRNTPFAAVAAQAARAHGADLGASELAFDRWASQRILDAARRLPRREAVTGRLLQLLVRERDAELARRGRTWYGLTSTAEHAEDVVALRAARLRACRRAFVGSPFLLAPALAVVLLAEEETRALRAIVERAGDNRYDAALARSAAGSQLGGG